MHEHVSSFHLLSIEIVGLILVAGFYFGILLQKMKMPSIIGYMVLGILIGPSLLNIVDQGVQSKLGFMTEVALGFVALSIGLELDFKDLKRQGMSIVWVIILESFGAFFLVFFGCWFYSGDIVMSLIFAGIAPASAPAGTVAVIHQYRARGPLTKALYAVVGFDDGLCIIIFGFSAALARSMLQEQTGAVKQSLLSSMKTPALEIVASVLTGIIIAVLYILLTRKLQNATEILIHTFAFVLLATGISVHYHLSLILTNMIVGFLIVNSENHRIVMKIKTTLPIVMQVLFILFFTLAGTNLHLSRIPALGLLGIVYIISRTTGLILGSRFGAIIGNAQQNVKDYIGLGILSQAGVAIGLSLIVSHEFKSLGKTITTAGGELMTNGEIIGGTVLATVTVSCIFFEIIGPILTHYVLKKTGEIR